MRGRGWEEVDDDVLEADPCAFDFAWDERGDLFAIYDSFHLDSWQRVNHFRNTRELCRKDLLAKNLKKAKRAADKDSAGAYDFVPLSFILPGEYGLFVEEFKKAQHAGATWIAKPCGRSQGQGIFLFTKLSQVSAWKSNGGPVTVSAAAAAGRLKKDAGQGSAADNSSDETPLEVYVVQKYISNPYLIGGRKFDMRIYAAVMSWAPLTVYLYRAGFCRFTSAAYDPSDLDNTYIHLTNVAVQKTSATYNADTGGKLPVSKLKQYLIARHGHAATDAAFVGIQDIVMKSLQAVTKLMISDKHCFELYGYDIMLDSNLKPWLIEVNASPSLTANTRDDFDLKYKLLNDLLDLVDMEGRLGPAGYPAVPLRMGGFDLIWRDPVGPIINKAAHMGAAGPTGTAGAGGATSSASSDAGLGIGQGHGAGISLGPAPPGGLGGGACVHGTMLGADFDPRLNEFPPLSKEKLQELQAAADASAGVGVTSSGRGSVGALANATAAGLAAARRMAGSAPGVPGWGKPPPKTAESSRPKSQGGPSTGGLSSGPSSRVSAAMASKMAALAAGRPSTSGTVGIERAGRTMAHVASAAALLTGSRGRTDGLAAARPATSGQTGVGSLGPSPSGGITTPRPTPLPALGSPSPAGVNGAVAAALAVPVATATTRANGAPRLPLRVPGPDTPGPYPTSDTPDSWRPSHSPSPAPAPASPIPIPIGPGSGAGSAGSPAYGFSSRDVGFGSGMASGQTAARAVPAAGPVRVPVRPLTLGDALPVAAADALPVAAAGGASSAAGRAGPQRGGMPLASQGGRSTASQAFGRSAIQPAAPVPHLVNDSWGGPGGKSKKAGGLVGFELTGSRAQLQAPPQAAGSLGVGLSTGRPPSQGAASFGLRRQAGRPRGSRGDDDADGE